MTLPCPQCGLMRHPKGCTKRKRSGKHTVRPVVSFDCETVAGVGIVLFLASGSDRAARWIYSAEGLNVRAVLDWMLDVGSGARAFGFYFDYDVNQIVALLPEPHQAQLAAQGRVTFEQWKIRHVPGKQFRLTHRTTGKSLTVWDVSGWAQCSFARLCDDWQLGTESERETIRAMKARRGEFENAAEAELVGYTTLECALLSDWVARLLQLHTDCGIELRAYSGPGSTASALVRARGWKPPAIPPPVELIAEQAFFGGRSEISCIGPVAGPIYSYDINSAYPTAIANLPELEGARWYRVRRHVPGAWGFYRVQWRTARSGCWGLFPVRGARLPSGHRSVSLLYPSEGDGWYHSLEVDNGLALEPRAVQVVDGWIVEPRGAPFAWIKDTAAERMRYKASGDARAFPLKVGLNSVYGKLAQHSGTHPLQCLAYAGAVTATTRAALLSLAYSRAHAVLLMATDGILSTEPLPCDVGPNLGQWELAVYDSAWMLQAGVYWAGSKKRTRGIDARGLELETVAELWRKRRTRAQVTLPTRRVLSYRLCAAHNRLQDTATWETTERTVRFTPGPRRRSYRWQGERLLTVPSIVADYRAQAVMDQIVLDCDTGSQYDELEALPEWAMPD